MKNLTIILLLFLSYSLTAQENAKPNFRHEIGLNLYSYNGLYQYLPENTSGFYFGSQHTFLNGLSYRYHFKQGSIRVNLQYQYTNYPEQKDDEPVEAGKHYAGSIWSFETSIGYERYFGNKKLKPYFALDLSYTYGNNSTYALSCAGPLCDPYIIPELKTNMVGLAPAIGISYQISKHFSFRLESSVFVGAFQLEEYSRIQLDEKTTKDVSEIVMFNPLSTCSINFNF